MACSQPHLPNKFWHTNAWLILQRSKCCLCVREVITIIFPGANFWASLHNIHIEPYDALNPICKIMGLLQGLLWFWEFVFHILGPPCSTWSFPLLCAYLADRAEGEAESDARPHPLPLQHGSAAVMVEDMATVQLGREADRVNIMKEWLLTL